MLSSALPGGRDVVVHCRRCSGTQQVVDTQEVLVNKEAGPALSGLDPPVA